MDTKGFGEFKKGDKVKVERQQIYDCGSDAYRVSTKKVTDINEETGTVALDGRWYRFDGVTFRGRSKGRGFPLKYELNEILDGGVK